MSEPFNPYHHTLYYEIQENGALINHHDYKANRFWKSYDLDSKGNFLITKVFEPKHLAWEDEKLHRLRVITSASKSNILIVHNHLSPLDHDVLNRLTELSSQNYFTSRIDKKMQLSSYAIAYHTKKFIDFTGDLNSEIYPKMADEQVLENLSQRIVQSNEVVKLIKNCIHIAYEDMAFSDFDNTPKKQVKNSWNQIASEDKILIIKLLEKYGLL